MNLWLLRSGHKVRIRDGAEAEVLEETEDGAWIRVRYLEVEDDPSLAGTEDLVSEAEVEALLGVVRTGAWSDKVAVIVYRVPESEEHEGGYEAETMTGIPYGVKVSSGADSAEAALNHLLAGLRVFGFAGRIAVEDATYIGGVQRYEIERPGS